MSWRSNWTGPMEHIEEEHPRRRVSGLQSGENYHDLGLDQPNERQLQLIRRLGSEALLKADAIPEWHEPNPDLSECRSVWLNSLEARVREGE
ncbi:unnamed protein product [Leptidea sinapis]|uniref:Uncharacterized protein n=1 Tax=Leptidea sinapis TaxID=189913 RepID=A0A5E4PW79_9NEOP|nr:unnamed protein product [Leptidea sinapis]